MRNISAEYKPVYLIAPAVYAAGTTTGTAVQISPNEEQDAVAIVQVGAIAGSPTSTTVTVTIAASATQNGSYTTLTTCSAVPTTAGQVGSYRVLVNTALYSWIKATSVVGFTGGTTPSVAVGVTLLQKQTVATDSNLTAIV